MKGCLKTALILIGAVAVFGVFVLMCDVLVESFDEESTEAVSITDYTNKNIAKMSDNEFMEMLLVMEKMSEEEIEKAFDSMSLSNQAAFITRFNALEDDDLEDAEDDDEYYDDDEEEDDDDEEYVDEDDEDEVADAEEEEKYVAPAPSKQKPTSGTKTSSNKSDYKPQQTAPGESDSEQTSSVREAEPAAAAPSASTTSGSNMYQKGMNAYNSGDGTTAIKCFESDGSADALHMVAEIYRNGLGSVKKNPVRAMMYDKKAKEAGYKN